MTSSTKPTSPRGRRNHRNRFPISGSMLKGRQHLQPVTPIVTPTDMDSDGHRRTTTHTGVRVFFFTGRPWTFLDEVTEATSSRVGTSD
jgi:hypothetical protein